MKVFQSSRIVHLVEVVITMVFKLILKKQVSVQIWILAKKIK